MEKDDDLIKVTFDELLDLTFTLPPEKLRQLMQRISEEIEKREAETKTDGTEN